MQLHTEKSSQFVGGRLWLGIRYRYVICQNELAPDRICGQHVCVRSPIQLEVLEDGGAYLTRIERVQAKAGRGRAVQRGGHLFGSGGREAASNAKSRGAHGWACSATFPPS